MATAQDVNTAAQPHCGTCGYTTDMKFTIQCTDCTNWIHYTCSALPLYMLLCLARTTRRYTCETCSFERYADPTWTTEASEAMDRMRKTETSCSPTISSPNGGSDLDTPSPPLTPPPLPQEDVGVGNSTPGTKTTQSVTEPQTTNHPALGAPLGSTPEDMDLGLTQQTREQATPTQVGVTAEPVSTLVVNRDSHHSHPQPPSTEVHVVEPRQAATTPKPERYTKVCRFYKRGRCRYGVSGRGCNFNHPKPCQKFINHGPRDERGCRLEGDCPNYHPALCRGSLLKQECFNRDCRFTHIRGTRRQQTATRNSAAAEPVYPIAANPPAAAQTRTINGDLNNSFLEMFMELRTHIVTMNKVVEAQGVALQNLAKPQPQQNHPAQMLPAPMAPMTPSWPWPRIEVN